MSDIFERADPKEEEQSPIITNSLTKQSLDLEKEERLKTKAIEKEDVSPVSSKKK